MSHYDSYGENVAFLVLTPEQVALLPPALAGVAIPDRADDFQVVLVDTQTGSEYTVAYSFCHLDDSSPFYDSEADDVITGEILHPYMHHQHWCNCRRMDDIENQHPGVRLPTTTGFVPRGRVELGEDSDCPDGRILVKTMTHPKLPGLVLFTEMADKVLSEDERP